jgi:hypothetical protein
MMTNRMHHTLSKKLKSKGLGSVILYQSVGPVHHTPLCCWVLIPRQLPVSASSATPAALFALLRSQGQEKAGRYLSRRENSLLSAIRWLPWFSRGSRGSHGSRSRSSLPPSQRPSNVGSPLARSNSFSPTATVTDAQSRAEVASSRGEKLTFTDDTESYNVPRMAPKLDRSRSKLTHGNTLRNKLGYGWTTFGLGALGRKDKDKEDLFTEVDRTSSSDHHPPRLPSRCPPGLCTRGCPASHPSHVSAFKDVSAEQSQPGEQGDQV